MPETQDILVIGFNYKKTEEEKNKVIAAMKEILDYADKFSGLKDILSTGSGFAASKKSADDLTKILKEQEKVIDSYARKVKQSAEAQVADAKAKEESRFAQQKMNRELKATVEIENTEAGTIARARAELKALNILRNNTSTATKEGREQLKLYNAEIDRNNNLIKENADAALKQKLNIGNYQSAFNGFAEGLRGITDGLLATVGITAGLSGIISFFQDSIGEATQAEQATVRFKNALSNIGRLDVFERLTEKANEFADTFKYLDNDDITEVFQQLISYGKLTEKQITDLTPVIINFSAKTGQSLTESASTIIKALEGNARAMKDFGISVKEGSTVAERLGIVMTELKGKVDGAAEAFGQTFAGQVATSKQEVADLKEEIGTKLLPLMSGFYASVSNTITGIGEIFSNVGKFFSSAYDSGKLVFGIMKDIVTLSPSNISARVAIANAESTANKMAIKDETERAEIQQQVRAFAREAAEQTLDEQKRILKGQIALKDASVKALDDIHKKGKFGRDEERRAALEYIKSRDIVLALERNIAATQDKRVLGLGDPNKVEKAKKDSKDITDAVAELRKELSKIQSNFDIGQITGDQADLDRVKAYQKAFDEIFERGGSDSTPVVQQLTVEVSPISLRVMERQIADFARKNSTKVDLLPPPENAKKRLDNVKSYVDDEAKLYEEVLQRELVLQETASLAEQKQLQDRFNEGKVSREKYENDLIAIQLKYALKAGTTTIDYLQREVNLYEAGTKAREDAEKRLAAARLAISKNVTDQQKKDNERIIQDIRNIQSAMNDVFGLVGGVIDISVTKQKNALQELEDQQQKNYENEIARINASSLSDQEKADKLNILDKQRQAQKARFDEENRKADRKKAEFDKATAIMNIILNTAVAVAKVIANPFQAVLVAALGAAQLAIAAATPIPKFAKGVKNKQTDGFGIYGEAGFEKVEKPGHKPFIATSETFDFLPKGTNITPISANEINSIMYRSMAVQTASNVNKPDKSEMYLRELVMETRKKKAQKVEFKAKISYDTTWETYRRNYYS